MKRSKGPQSVKAIYDKYVQRLTEIFFISSTIEEPEIDIKSIYERSTKTLGSYVTLDWEHRKSIKGISIKIKDYVNDITQRRPLNIIMMAEPGSGKSHFVKCLAEHLQNINVSAVTYNLATMQQLEDLTQPLEAVRNLKVQDKLPILFLDEFDSDVKNYPLLLPLLWDGEIHLGHRELKMGKIVIILAGSKPEIVETIKKIQEMGKSSNTLNGNSKLIDILSRINGGGFDIPNLEKRKADKICLTISLLQKRFGKNLRLVPWALLKFVGETNFRYGVRSITLLIDSIPYSDQIFDKLDISDIQLPLSSENELKTSNLAYHIVPSEDDQDIAGIIKRWSLIKDCKTLVCFMEAPEDEESTI